ARAGGERTRCVGRVHANGRGTDVSRRHRGHSTAGGGKGGLLQVVQLAVDEPDAIADAQTADLLVVEVADAAILETDRDAIDLVFAARPLLDRVAGDAAGDRAADRRKRAARAAAELVADDATDDRAEDHAGPRGPRCDRDHVDRADDALIGIRHRTRVRRRR